MKIGKKTKPKRIGIDARFYGPISKGIGRYIQEVADNIIKMDTENEYVVFLNKANFDEFICDGVRVKKKMVNVRWYGISEQILMPFFILTARVDLMHFPHFNAPIFCPVKFVVTIHDLILIKYPSIRDATALPFWLYKIKNIFYRIVIWLAVHRAKKVIAVSEFTKKDIVEKLKVNPKKIIVTYEGVAELLRGRDRFFIKKLDDKETLLEYNISNSFLLYVGNAYPHKNLKTLIEVFKNLREKYPDLRLVLVGKEDYFYKKIKKVASTLGLWHENVSDCPVIFAGYVPDAELEILYQKASAYVFPSLYEGFGLPPLEAMARGCVVASSNQSCLPEIFGDAVVYFNPNDKKEMAEKIEILLNNKKLRQELVEKGREQVKKYNWHKTAEKTLEIYKSVLF